MAIVTEGLVNYFPREDLLQIWTRFASLAKTPGSVYLTDIHLQSAMPSDVFARAWRGLIRFFTQGGTFLHFHDGQDAKQALTDAGFSKVLLHDPCDEREEIPDMPESGGRSVVHVIEGRVD